MFKLFVVVMLCVIALHACAADTSAYVVHLPLTNHAYFAVVNGADIHTVNLPFVPFESIYTRIW